MEEEFEDTKGTIRILISKTNRQHNWPKEKVQKDKQRSTKHTYKTKDRVTRTPLKTGGELRCSGREAVPAPLVEPVVLIYLHTRSLSRE
jgi:transcriptional regulator NrdR family protein